MNSEITLKRVREGSIAFYRIVLLRLSLSPSFRVFSIRRVCLTPRGRSYLQADRR